MKTNFDVVVVGLGAMGSATLYHLARRGLTVCGIEQFTPGHKFGSSHGETRIIRKAYFEHPDYLPLLDRTYQLWHDLEEESGEQLLYDCGLIVSGEPASEAIRGLTACYRAHAVRHEIWTPEDLRRHFPQFHLPASHQIFFDPYGGYLLAEKCIAAHLRMARQHGAVVMENTRVHFWQSGQNEVAIHTRNAEIRARKMVVCAGAWSSQLLEDLGLHLEIWRKVVFWYRMPRAENYAPGRFPIFYIEQGPFAFYGFPIINPAGLKVAEHAAATPISSPQACRRSLQPADENPVRRFLQTTFGEQPLQRTVFSVCMYTMSPDRHFIVDRHPQYGNVLLAAGFSGHGFKFSAVIGQILTELALEGACRLPIQFLRLARFKQQK